MQNTEANVNNFPITTRPLDKEEGKFAIRMNLKGRNGKNAFVITAWMIDEVLGEVRMTNVYVDKKRRMKNEYRNL